MRSNTTRGIIYRIYSSGQSDKVLNIINTDGSKTSLLAKGAKKSTSRKAHSIELCNQVEIKIIEGYQIPIISEIKVLNEFIDWKNNDAGMLLAQLFCEIIDKLCFENNVDKNLYNIFFESLKNSHINKLITANAFILKAIWHTGSINSIVLSAVSGKALNAEDVYFTNQLAGYVSKEDLNKNIELHGESIKPVIPKLQKFLIENPLQNVGKIDVNNEHLMKMLQINLDWFEIITEQRLKSKSIILNLVGKLSK
jgi:DNA repair protein RecO (recombination protein O)